MMVIEQAGTVERRPDDGSGWSTDIDGRMPGAVILAAGAGSRLRQCEQDPPKPLTKLLGVPLIERAIRSCCEAGVRDFVVVVGYQRHALIPFMDSLRSKFGIRLHVAENRRWALGNGSSVLASEPHVRGRFFLLMGDHVFHPQFLQRLVERDDGHSACALVVDRDIESVHDLPEASKVQLSRGRIIAIGKRLASYDGVDTGVFLCRPPIFDALREGAADGDHSLGGAVQRLALRGEVTWAPAGGLFWQDVDTPHDLDVAEASLLAERTAGAGLPTG